MSRRQIRAAVVAIVVMALIAIGAMLQRNQPLPDTAPSAAIQVK